MIMDLKTLADAIGLNKEAKDIINSSNISDIDFNSLIESFYKDSNVFFNKELSKENIQFNLVFISKLAVFLYPKFIDNGYTDKIYYDTFSDIRVWNENCVKETGICGLKETDWLSLHLKMQLFKIGRLQFQFNILDKDYKVEDKIYNKGTNVFSLHIQRGEPLTDISCIESIKEAKKYFGNEMICICSSWLLSPVLNKFLDKNSNIIKFQNMFDIKEFDCENHGGERFLFGYIGDIKSYNAQTSLQKLVLDYLLEGKCIGVALGILKHN